METRHTLGEKYHEQGIAHLPCPDVVDLLFPALSLFAVITAAVIIAAVPVVFPVGLVVLLAVRIHVPEGEAVMAV